jgi:hypothetical protein
LQESLIKASSPLLNRLTKSQRKKQAKNARGVAGAMGVLPDEMPIETPPDIKGVKHKDEVKKGFMAFVEKARAQAQLMPVRPSGAWERLEVLVDSGATVSVLSPTMGAAYEVKSGEASRAGVMYGVANGDELLNLGEKFMAVLTSEGTVRGHNSQVADVSKALQSVHALMQSNHAVVFDSEGCVVINKESGEVNQIEDDGINFKLIYHVIPENELQGVMAMMDSGFTRQG